MSNVFTISGSPHIHGTDTVKKIMYGVIIAMLPSLFISVYYFGLSAIKITVVAVVACLLFEYLIQRFLLKQDVKSFQDGSAVITGMLLAFNLPSSLPLWMVVIGSLVSIGIAKMTFGGIGKNPFNPALVGRVFLLISFPVHMTSWLKPTAITAQMTDAITGPTALGIVKEGVAKGESVSQLLTQIPSYTDMFIGNMAGSLGEVSALAILIGALYMLVKKIITWHIPVSFILAASLFAGILWFINPLQHADPIFHLLTGGLMLGAVFMATDMVTSPMTKSGQLLFGAGCGVLTILIRVFGAYPEGVSFAILIMNAFVPLINKGFKPIPFGLKK